MNWLSSLIQGHSRSFHLTLIVVFSLALIVKQTGLSQVVQTALSNSLYTPFWHAGSTIEEFVKFLEDRKTAARSEAEYQLLYSLFRDVLDQNNRLRRSLDFTERPEKEYRLVPAEINRIVYLVGEVPHRLEINKGIRDGIETCQAVVSREGLVGRVAEVQLDRATVQLLTDPSNSVAARMQNSRELGIVRFRIPGGLVLTNVSIQDSVNLGDTVITSGTGGCYPKGIRVGILDTVAVLRKELLLDIVLTPLADFHTLEEVFVVIENK